MDIGACTKSRIRSDLFCSVLILLHSMPRFKMLFIYEPNLHYAHNQAQRPKETLRCLAVPAACAGIACVAN